MPSLLIITDRHQAQAPLDTIAEAAFRAGARWLLLREKDLDAPARRDLLRRLVALAVPFGACVTVSADVTAAKATGAAGVHLPAGADIAAARAALGPQAMVGASAHDGAEIRAAATAGADYVTLSPIFESASKPDYGPALGQASLRRACARSPVPVIALGGVDPDNAGACLAAGAAGIAVMGAIMRAPDPGAMVAKLLAAMRPG